MSVLVTVKVPADTEKFRRYAAEHGEVLEEIAAEGKAQGAIHHRFAIGDGFMFVIDEWESAEGFQGFFNGNDAIAGVMAESGAQGEPEITIAEAISTADEF